MEIENEYLGGLLDAEGYTGINVAETNEWLYPYPTLVIALKDKYFAGFFDGDGQGGIRVDEGLHISPTFRIGLSLTQSNYDLLKAIELKYRGHTRKKSNMVIWSVSKLNEVAEITDILLEHCVIKRPQLLIIKEVTELMFTDEHLTPEGLYYILLLTEKIKEMNSRSVGRKERNWIEVFKKKVGIMEFTRIASLLPEKKVVP